MKLLNDCRFILIRLPNDTVPTVSALPTAGSTLARNKLLYGLREVAPDLGVRVCDLYVCVL